MIPIKTEEDLEQMRSSGRILSWVMHELQKQVKPNISTLELDRIAGELIVKKKAKAAFKGYKGFPGNICASINEEIVHGIPSDRKLKNGDILSLDLGVNCGGYFSDAAMTIAVGVILPEIAKLIEVTRESLIIGVKEARINNRISDISNAIQSYVEKNKFSVVREFVGHGIGKHLHEEPEIPNFGQPHLGDIIKNGMVLAIEPMVNMGGWGSKILENNWTAVTLDGKPSAHFEYTVAVTEKGPEVLTELFF
jgi:methionyl aminopeptidase